METNHRRRRGPVPTVLLLAIVTLIMVFVGLSPQRSIIVLQSPKDNQIGRADTSSAFYKNLSWSSLTVVEEHVPKVSPPSALPSTPAAPNSVSSVCNANLLGKWPESNPYFSQVHSPHIGYVKPDDLRAALLTLTHIAPLFNGNITNTLEAPKSFKKDDVEGTAAALRPKLVLFALDGTLLNLMRWGRIHNDNDIDVGFYFEGITHIMEQYYLMLGALEAADVIFPQSARDRKKLHSSNQAVKVGKCKHRGQIMQCRHKQTGVYIDLFGPDTLFSTHSNLNKPQLVPIRHCRSFDFTFPCPQKPLQVLTSVTLDFGQASEDRTDQMAQLEGIAHHRSTYNEFKGCPLFPRNSSEQSASHLKNIIEAGLTLHECGYPNLLQGTLLPENPESSAIPDLDCFAIMERAGIHFNKKQAFVGISNFKSLYSL